MKPTTTTHPTLATAAALAIAATLPPSPAQAVDWKEQSVSPVTNPLFFEDPQIQTEIRPIFLYHRIDRDFLAGEGDVKVYAAQARWAVNDRLAIIATKDGYIDLNLDNAPTLSHQGWADIAAGVKYAIVKDDDNKVLITPGVKIELPTGNRRVFQGNGSGEWDVFVSGAKGWDKLRLLGSFGSRIPNDFDEETAQIHYSAQLDYHLHKYFIPFVALNGFTVLTEGDSALPLRVEGIDLINFGSPHAGGKSQVAAGVGFRSRLCANADFGFAYELGLVHPRGLYRDRFTIDFVVHF